MAEQLLKLENIYKNFGNVKVLKDVNITINKGEVVERVYKTPNGEVISLFPNQSAEEAA